MTAGLRRLSLGEAAPAIRLMDAGGKPVSLAERWADGPTVLTFLRHFGCLFCREWLGELNTHRAAIEAAGLQTIAVAMGEPKHNQRYCGTLAPGVTCLTDETTAPYAAYGLGRGRVFGELMSPGVMAAGARATRKGYLPGQPVGDVTILPGTFIVDRQGSVRYAYYSAHAGDHPAIEALISAAVAV